MSPNRFETNLPNLDSIAGRLDGLSEVLCALAALEEADRPLRLAILLLSDNATILAEMVRAHDGVRA